MKKLNKKIINVSPMKMYLDDHLKIYRLYYKRLRQEEKTIEKLKKEFSELDGIKPETVYEKNVLKRKKERLKRKIEKEKQRLRHIFTISEYDENSEKDISKIVERFYESEKERKIGIKNGTVQNPVGRPRKNFPYEIAREIAISEGIQSATQYEKWYKINQPARMPKRPDRAYKKVWKGWWHFLGMEKDESSFKRRNFRSFEEARAYARSLKLKGVHEWIEFTKNSDFPKDIPARPDIAYRNKWLSWLDFLGKDGIMLSKKEEIEIMIPVLYIAKPKYLNIDNVYIVNTVSGGEKVLKEHLDKIDCDLVVAYYMEESFDHKKFISLLSHYEYSTTDDMFEINNIYSVLEFLDIHLRRVQKNWNTY